MLSSVAWSERFEYFSSFLKYIFVVFLYKSSHCITRERKNADFHFLIDSQIIDVVQEYTYLGTRMSSSGNFSVWREHLKEKALQALFSLIRHTNLSKLKAALVCKISDTMISPILTYNSEIWGVYAKPDFKTWDGSQIEKAHLQFCKRYLEVTKKASNITCRAELGRFP